MNQDPSPPHIGLNAHLLSLQQSYRSAGISWYIYNLLLHLTQLDAPYRYTAFLSDAQFQPPNGLAIQRSRWPTHTPPVRIAWEQLALPFLLRREKIDLLHALAFVAPAMTACPFVVTVYDLSFLHFPEAFRPWKRLYLRLFTRHSVRRARAVITISESTRRDVMRAFGAAAERVHTIYCGVDESFRPLPAEQVEAFRARRGLPERFIFQLGTLEPRKNVTGLLHAYAAWRRRDPHAPPLVIGGGKGWYYRQVFRLVEDLGLAGAVFFPGYLPQEELPLWYNAARLFVYPSLFEGFGLPVLEAMACGTPVITSNVSSLPEVAGDAARLVNPTDTDALSRAMEAVFRQPDVARAMRRRGLQQAARFRWRETARQTLQIYQQALCT
ncbi:MAG: glycosyltransferase family 1 protein [Caldilineae bacterium]|nr:MAG: glycosyltransferase family 1 protein [Caldilineae bacterium]